MSHVPRQRAGAVPARPRLRLRPALYRELGSLAAAAVLYPLGATEAADRRLLRLLVAADSPSCHRTPVVLVHGYGGNRSNWRPLECRLAAAGFVNVHAMSYNPMVHDIPELADLLVRDCIEAMSGAGEDRVHVVGHSLGGVILRYAIQRRGLSKHVGTAVTVAAPHAGTPVARLGRGRVAAALRPSSPLLAELDATAQDSPVRWVAYYSDSDVVVPPRSARLSPPALRARNVLVPDQGHISILFSPPLLDGAVADLLAGEAVTTTVAA